MWGVGKASRRETETRQRRAKPSLRVLFRTDLNCELANSLPGSWFPAAAGGMPLPPPKTRTTTINHIIETKRAQRVAIIVNDIAELNIDGKQIGDKILETEKKLVELKNGCLCCTLQGDLFDETLELEGTHDYSTFPDRFPAW